MSPRTSSTRRPAMTLWGHVAGGSHHLLADVGDVVVDPLGEAEVGSDRPARGLDQHVAGLDVAMDEAAVVGGGERARRLLDHLDRQLGIEPAAMRRGPSRSVPPSMKRMTMNSRP